MHASIWVLALAIFTLAAGYIVPDECVEDDILLSLQQWIIDADPFCRGQLGIDDITSTVVLPTSRTTITVHRTTDVTITSRGTITEPSATTTISVPTAVEAPSIKIPKRAPAPTAAAQFYKALPFARSIRDRVAPEALVSSVSSGCECLYLETQTVQVFSTPKTTRTLTANARQTIVKYRNTVFAGITTEIVIGTPSITPSFISVPSTPTSSVAVTPPFNNVTLRSTISIPTTSVSLQSSIPLLIPTLPSSGLSVSTVGNLSFTRSFNLSTSISNIPTPSTPGVYVPSLSIPALLNTSRSVSASPTFITLVNATSISSGILPSGTVRTQPYSNFTSSPIITGVPSTAPLSSVNITSIIGSTGLPISPPILPRPIGPFNNTSIIGSTGLPISIPSFTISSSPINITSVVRSIGFSLTTSKFSPTIPFNNSLNGTATLGPTAISLGPNSALRNYTELSSSCSSLGFLFCSGANSQPASPLVTVITSTSIFVITSVLPVPPKSTLPIGPTRTLLPTPRIPILGS